MTWIIDYEELKKIATAEEDDSVVGNLYEKNEILRSYKKAFLQPGVLDAVFNVLLRPLQVEYRVRTTRDTAIIRLGLSLFRNLVAIRDAETSLAGSMDQFLSSVMQVRGIIRWKVKELRRLLCIYFVLKALLTPKHLLLFIDYHRTNYWNGFNKRTSCRCW